MGTYDYNDGTGGLVGIDWGGLWKNINHKDASTFTSNTISATNTSSDQYNYVPGTDASNPYYDGYTFYDELGDFSLENAIKSGQTLGEAIDKIKQEKPAEESIKEEKRYKPKNRFDLLDFD